MQTSEQPAGLLCLQNQTSSPETFARQLASDSQLADPGPHTAVDAFRSFPLPDLQYMERISGGAAAATSGPSPQASTAQQAGWRNRVRPIRLTPTQFHPSFLALLLRHHRPSPAGEHRRHAAEKMIAALRSIAAGSLVSKISWLGSVPDHGHAGRKSRCIPFCILSEDADGGCCLPSMRSLLMRNLRGRRG